MSGKKGPEPEPEPEPSSTHSALDHVEAHAETRADEHSRLVSKASADVSSIGLGSMEAQMAAARAEMEEQIRKEEEEKEARRKGKRVGGGRRKREERKEGVPLTAPSLSGRPRSRPGSASKSPRLPPLQHVPQQPGAEDRAAAAGELTREQQMRDYPAYDGGGDGGGPPPDGGARGALLTSDLVTVGAPALDYQVLNDALLSVGPPVDELRTDLEDDAPFTERVHNLIDARIAPPITDIYRTLAKREQEFQAFATMVTGRLEKLESELATTKQQLAAERLERKQEASALAARVLRAESTLTEKAEQQELDALLKSVITTIGTSRHPFLPDRQSFSPSGQKAQPIAVVAGSIGQRIGEGEANLAACRVAQTQTQEQMLVVRADIVVAREKEAVDVAALESSLQELHNKQEQLAAKVGKWRFGEGTSLMDAMWQRSREERVHSIVSADLDVLRERESINLDDTALEVIRHDIVAIWIACFSRSPRCRC